ncbi:MAG TPA: hypothetical protein VIW47_08250 [Nitrospiraceae bacterium]|jgi:hypothetical protein
MVHCPKVVSVLTSAFVLGLGLSSVALASENSLATDETKAEQNAERKGSLPGLLKQDADTRRGIHTMKGEVLRLEPDHYVIKRSDGKQVSLHVDETTKVTRTFAPGEWIEAKVIQYNDGHYALSISPVK